MTTRSRPAATLLARSLRWTRKSDADTSTSVMLAACHRGPTSSVRYRLPAVSQKKDFFFDGRRGDASSVMHSVGRIASPVYHDDRTPLPETEFVGWRLH